MFGRYYSAFRISAFLVSGEMTFGRLDRLPEILISLGDFSMGAPNGDPNSVR